MYHQAKTVIIPLTRQQMLENMVTHYLMEKNPPGFSSGCKYYVAPSAAMPYRAAQVCGVGLQLGLDLAKEVETAFTDGATVRDIFSAAERYDEETGELAQKVVDILGIKNIADLNFLAKLQSSHDDSALDLERESGRVGQPILDTELPKFRRALLHRLMDVAVEYNLVLRPVHRG